METFMFVVGLVLLALALFFVLLLIKTVVSFRTGSFRLTISDRMFMAKQTGGYITTDREQMGAFLIHRYSYVVGRMLPPSLLFTYCGIVGKKHTPQTYTIMIISMLVLMVILPRVLRSFAGALMSKGFRRILKPRAPYLTYPQHYDQTVREAPGEKCGLTLVHAGVEGPFVNLVYQWNAELSDDEADRLDTRARAYIACAISDAATTAGLACQPGPPHGQRPSWYVGGESMPISLVNAGLDVSDKTCFMQIGSGMLIMRSPKGSECHCKRLVAGFQAQFREISV